MTTAQVIPEKGVVRLRREGEPPIDLTLSELRVCGEVASEYLKSIMPDEFLAAMSEGLK